MQYRIIALEGSIYRGNLAKDFSHYCFSRVKKTRKYWFQQIGIWFLRRFHFMNTEKYYQSYFKFLKKVDNKQTLATSFLEKYQYKLSPWYLKNKNKKTDIIVSENPMFLATTIMNILGITKIVATSFDENTNLVTGNIVRGVEAVKQVKDTIKKNSTYSFYGSRECEIPLFESTKDSFIVKRTKNIHYKKRRITHPIRKCIGIFLFLFITSWIVTCITLAFSVKVAEIHVIQTYYQQADIMWMNFLPIFISMTFLFFLCNRLWATFGITTTLWIGLSLVNRFKLLFRDDAFIFNDLRLAKEALIMTERYPITFSPLIIGLFVAIIVITILLFFFQKTRIKKKRVRFSLLAITTISMIILYGTLFTNQRVYNKIGDQSKINVWIAVEQFQSRGFVYPFIYSSKDVFLQKPKNYSEKAAKNLLNQYQNTSIPEEQKVNIITIMLEAYQDFSKFDIALTEDIYAPFHKLEKESYSGKLVSNVFGGGTINTERSYMTGLYNMSEFRTNTNSFIWYLKNQGYRTEAYHPIYGTFYNRINANQNLGFDYFENYDNYYKNIQYAFLTDEQFFPYIIRGYENNLEKNQPYFSFTTTYQNHGPYPDYDRGLETILKRNENMDEKAYYTVNDYLNGIKATNLAIQDLITYFKKQEEPVVVIIFADHNPYLGENGYQELGINLDTNTEEGFYNYYEVPYLMWANEKAKEVTNKSFVGEAPTISPTYLMSELFSYLGWQGNQYMQVLMNLQKSLPIIHEPLFLEDNQLTTTLSEKEKELWQDFRKVEYYYQTNFKK